MNLCLYTRYLSLGQVGSFYKKNYFLKTTKKECHSSVLLTIPLPIPPISEGRLSSMGHWFSGLLRPTVSLSAFRLDLCHSFITHWLQKIFFPSGESHCMITSFEQSMFVWYVSRLYCPHCSLKLSSEGCNGDKHKALEHKILPSLSRPGSMAYVARVRTTGSLITSSSQEHRRMQLWLAEWVFNSSIYWKVHFVLPSRKYHSFCLRLTLAARGLKFLHQICSSYHREAQDVQ